MKRDRLMLGNRYTLISNSKTILSFLNWKLQSKPFLWYGDLNLNQCQTDLSFLYLKTPIKAVFVEWRLASKFFVR